MKSSRNLNNKQSKQGMSKKPRPEIRDDLDSRKQKEAGYQANKVIRSRKNGKKSRRK